MSSDTYNPDPGTDTSSTAGRVGSQFRHMMRNIRTRIREGSCALEVASPETVGYSTTGAVKTPSAQVGASRMAAGAGFVLLIVVTGLSAKLFPDSLEEVYYSTHPAREVLLVALPIVFVVAGLMILYIATKLALTPDRERMRHGLEFFAPEGLEDNAYTTHRAVWVTQDAVRGAAHLHPQLIRDATDLVHDFGREVTSWCDPEWSPQRMPAARVRLSGLVDRAARLYRTAQEVTTPESLVERQESVETAVAAS